MVTGTTDRFRALHERPAHPVSPRATHHETFGSLPVFPSGAPTDRLARARDYLREASSRVEAFHRGGAAGLSTSRLLAASTDTLVQGLFSELSAELDAPPGLALVSLGSYGRRELSPHSDLDLLLLRPPGVPRPPPRRSPAPSPRSCGT